MTKESKLKLLKAAYLLIIAAILAVWSWSLAQLWGGALFENEFLRQLIIKENKLGSLSGAMNASITTNINQTTQWVGSSLDLFGIMSIILIIYVSSSCIAWRIHKENKERKAKIASQNELG